MIDADTAKRQAAALMAAARHSPILTVRERLRVEAVAWQRVGRALHDAEGDELEAQLVMPGELDEGMLIYLGGIGAVEVMRVTREGSGIQILDPSSGKGPEWINLRRGVPCVLVPGHMPDAPPSNGDGRGPVVLGALPAPAEGAENPSGDPLAGADTIDE